MSRQAFRFSLRHFVTINSFVLAAKKDLLQAHGMTSPCWLHPLCYNNFTSHADNPAMTALQRIANDNKSNPNLVNHKLYNLFFEEDFIRLAHENVKPANWRQLPFSMRTTLVGDIVKDFWEEQFQFQPRGIKSGLEEGIESLGLSVPLHRDRVVLEAMRLVLEAIYEPIFLGVSHGSRPSRSCHSALRSIRKGVQDHEWALVSDIRKEYKIDRHVLVKLLEQKIGDKRFLRLVWKALKVGHGERTDQGWTFKSIWWGTRGQNTLSLLWTNVFFHALDLWVQEKKAMFDQGKSRALNPQWLSFVTRLRYLERRGDASQLKQLRKQIAQVPKRLWNDSGFRRVFYVRYVDDILLTFTASKEDVLRFQEDVKDFLSENLKLDVSGGKLRLSHLRKNPVLFLDTKICLLSGPKCSSGKRNQSLSGLTRLHAPMEKIIKELAHLGMVSEGGVRPYPVTFLSRYSHNQIVNYYNWIMRGCCNYYSFVDNFDSLTKYLRIAIRSSCVRTLTMKLKRQRSARTYKDFGAELAARYRVPLKDGQVVSEKLSEEELTILRNRVSVAKKLKVKWEDLKREERGLLQRFCIPRLIHEPNGDTNLEFRGDYLLFCSKKGRTEEAVKALRSLELLPPVYNPWDFKRSFVPPPRPRLSAESSTWN
ncbi:hypothetical protein BDL97_15G085900 [Sphagnum fallax]|nr:hypothetical protein BDL97_15G085900 [Sphagnum fallax]